MAGNVRTRVFGVVGVVVCVTVAVSLLGVGIATSAGEARFSKSTPDYFPATIDGQAVGLDPRSTTAIPVGSPNPSCRVPADGVSIVPLVTEAAHIIEDTVGGLYQCPVDAPAGADQYGTDYVAGLEAAVVTSSLPALSRRALIKDKATSIKTRVVRVGKGVRQRIFLFGYGTGDTVCVEDCVGAPDEVDFVVAAAEPRQHLLVTAVTRTDNDPVPYLKAMLKAGIG